MPIRSKHKGLWQMAGFGLLIMYCTLGFPLAQYTLTVSDASLVPFFLFMLSLSVMGVIIASDKLSGIVERIVKKVVTFE